VKQLEQSLEEKISEMSRVSQRLKAGPEPILKNYFIKAVLSQPLPPEGSQFGRSKNRCYE
jgi:hypothetical protein